MKLLIVLCSIFALAFSSWTARTKEEFWVDRDECFKSEKLSDHCIAEIKNKEFPDEPKCYFRCIAMKAGIWDDATGYDMEKTYDQIVANGLEVSKEDLSKCNSDEQKDADPCKWTTNFNKCVHDNKYVTKKE